jgi:fatty acid desaturase
VIDSAVAQRGKLVKRHKMRRDKVVGAAGWFALLIGTTMITRGGVWATAGLIVWVLAMIVMLLATVSLVRDSHRKYA